MENKSTVLDTLLRPWTSRNSSHFKSLDAGGQSDPEFSRLLPEEQTHHPSLLERGLVRDVTGLRHGR